MRPIKVPKTPKKAFNPDRRPSALLLGQVAHLEWAARPAAQRQPPQMRQVLEKGKPKSEAEAAERIAVLTKTVLENAAADRERQRAASRPVVQQAPAVAPMAAPSRPRGRRSKKPGRRKTRRRS
jgi:hypothetical protein